MAEIEFLPSMPRRTALALGALATLAPGTSQAAIVKHTVIGKDGWLFLIWDEPRRMDAGRIRQVSRIFNDLHEALARAGISLTIALTPAKSRIYRDMLPEDFQFAAEVLTRYDLTLEALRRPGTLVPDLNATLAALRRAQPQEALFFKADTHWTAAAAEAAASAIAAEMKAKFSLPPSPRPGLRQEGTTSLQQPRNDLAEALPRADRAKYPLQRFTARKLTAGQAAAGLLEDDSADVAVVGSSYMHPSYNFAAMLSNQLNRPVSLAWKVHSYGPYRTLLEYLGSPGFKRHKPKALVLSLHEVDLVSPPDSDAWSEPMDSAAFLAGIRRALAG